MSNQMTPKREQYLRNQKAKKKRNDNDSGKYLKINPKDSQFVNYDKAVSGKDLENPGTKFSKKGNFKKKLAEIESNVSDKDGNLLVPDFEMPDRVKLSKEQKADNEAIESQFDEDGYLDRDKVKQPKKTRKRQYRDKKFNQYKRNAKNLARRMGIPPGDKRNDGLGILKSQTSRYSKAATTPTLTIPDYSLNSDAGKRMMKIGQGKLSLEGMYS